MLININVLQNFFQLFSCAFHIVTCMINNLFLQTKANKRKLIINLDSIDFEITFTRSYFINLEKCQIEC
jgi:hypothetical protein